jgi:CRP-like cAMP-binding protein
MIAPGMPFSSPGFEKMLLSVPQLEDMLLKTQFGKELEPALTQALLEFLDAYRGEVGSVVCRQEEESAFLCIICRGRVDVVKKDVDHHDKVIASLGPGNVLGEMSLVDGEPRSATVVVHTPVELLVLTKAQYERLVDENPRVWGRLMTRIAAILSKRLRRTSGILAEYLQS